MILIIHDELNERRHEVAVDSNGSEGHCLTHDCPVAENDRCREFPRNTAMWYDLWRTEKKRRYIDG